MDKNIKKLISEAFNELYEEMVNEAPETLETKGMQTVDEMNAALERAIKRGSDRKLEFDFDALNGNSKEQENFNNAMDNLIETYLTPEGQAYYADKLNMDAGTVKQNAKSAILSALQTRKLKNLFQGFKNTLGREYADVIDDVFMRTAIEGFDNLVSGYKRGTGSFTGLVKKAMDNNIRTQITQGYTSPGGGGKYDALRGGTDSGISVSSMDATYGDDDKATLGDKISADDIDSYADDMRDDMDVVDSPDYEDGDTPWLKRTEKITTETGNLIKERLIGFIEDHVNNPNYPDITPEIAIVFTEALKGSTFNQIFNDFPEVQAKYKLAKNLPLYFRRFTKTKSAEEIDYLISRIFKIDFKLSNIDPTKLAQDYSMSPEWEAGNVDKKTGRKILPTSEKASKEMKRIQDELKNKLNDLGYKMTVNHQISREVKDEYTNKNLRKAIEDMESKGMEKEVREIYELLFKHKAEIKRDKGKGGYGSPLSVVPKSEKEEEQGKKDEFGGFFEGIDEKDVDKLMERVLRRLSLKENQVQPQQQAPQAQPQQVDLKDVALNKIKPFLESKGYKVGLFNTVPQIPTEQMKQNKNLAGLVIDNKGVQLDIVLANDSPEPGNAVKITGKPGSGGKDSELYKHLNLQDPANTPLGGIYVMSNGNFGSNLGITLAKRF